NHTPISGLNSLCRLPTMTQKQALIIKKNNQRWIRELGLRSKASNATVLAIIATPTIKLMRNMRPLHIATAILSLKIKQQRHDVQFGAGRPSNDCVNAVAAIAQAYRLAEKPARHCPGRVRWYRLHS